MESCWRDTTTYIAHFDILGFKNRINADNRSFVIMLLKSAIDEVIEKLEREVSRSSGTIRWLMYADTFILYSTTEDSSGYPTLARASKNLLLVCLQKRLPVRGALAYGQVTFGHNNQVLIGKAALEAYEYCEDQDWIGLLLTPSATTHLIEQGIYPSRSGFTNQDIPLKSEHLVNDYVYAFKFINGSTNFSCPQLPFLREMQSTAPETVQKKYKRTIDFIEKHYRVHSSPRK